MTDFLPTLQSRIEPYRARLADHPLYRSMHSIEDLQIFMESHVFAVWDFMSLLKALQRRLTCVELPWQPTADAASRRLVNEIVLGEESDSFEGRTFSHYELYLEAMAECGADTAPVTRFLEALRSGNTVGEALRATEVPAAAAAFVESTFRVIQSGSFAALAAAFTFGREDLIPEMFPGLVRELNAALPGRLRTFLFYLERHIEMDGDDHGPLALRMIANICGQDGQLWSEATEAAEAALQARLRLWDEIQLAVVRR